MDNVLGRHLWSQHESMETQSKAAEYHPTVRRTMNA
jgi:hypothetical protein